VQLPSVQSVTSSLLILFFFFNFWGLGDLRSPMMKKCRCSEPNPRSVARDWFPEKWPIPFSTEIFLLP
jgi:hypothetical protein